MSRWYAERLLQLANVDDIPISEREEQVKILICFGERYSSGKVLIRRREEVSAYQTVCPYLAINSCGDALSITHIPTGYSMMHGFRQLRTAELCAGALKSIFPWGINDDERAIRHRMSILPEKLQTWIKKWSSL